MTEAHERIAPAVLDLAMAVDWLDKTSVDFEGLTVQEAVEHLSVIKELEARLRQLDAGLERWVAAVFKDQGWKSNEAREFPGLGTVEVRRSTTRRAWRHDDAASDFVNAVIAETGGEVVDPFDLMARFRSAASVSGWKVGGFKAVGLNVNDYAECEPGTPTVNIVRAEP
jgi:hypothetical protein